MNKNNVTEIVLTTIPGKSDDERMVILLQQSVDGHTTLCLSQQSWGEGVGWFNQQSIELEPHQVALVKNALGSDHTRSRSPALPAAFRQINGRETGISQNEWGKRHGTATNGPVRVPRVVRADSA